MDAHLRVGWVIGDQLRRIPWVREAALAGGGVGLARYLWLARYVNKERSLGVHYGVYRPWQRYDAVVFLKSMGQRALGLLRHLQARGVPCIFDANVNYFELGGAEYYRGMLPTEEQRREAGAMAHAASAMIADSEFIAERGRQYSQHVVWIPDNVPMDMVPRYKSTRRGKRLRLLWSGEAVKLFELLAAEEALLEARRRIELVLVTNDLAALDRLYPETRRRLEQLLSGLSVRVIKFRSIGQLFKIYSEGGVFISPRFLDSPYNLGHTEWKITLAMACGRIALCSPVPSYVSVAKRAGNRGIRVPGNSEEWCDTFEELLVDSFLWEEEEASARSVVIEYYSTRAVASAHTSFVRKVV